MLMELYGYRIVQLGTLPLWRVEKRTKRWFRNTYDWKPVRKHTVYGDAYPAEFDNYQRACEFTEMRIRGDIEMAARAENLWKDVGQCPVK